jgi:hypothetical protein
MDEKYDVFISYSRKDYVENDCVIPGNIVSKVKETLDKMNVSYWFDEDGVFSGDEFAPLIARAIRNSEIFLFISSHNSNASDWTSNEIATAHAYKKKIIPFRVDDSVFNDAVILYIAKLDYIDYTKNQEKALNRLKDSIGTYLKQKAEREKLSEEIKRKEEERLKQAAERERELSRVRERLSNVSKELDSLRSQWQVSSTLYDELKAKEASLLGIAYQQHILTLPEIKSQTGNQVGVEGLAGDTSNSFEEKSSNPFKRLAQWFKNPNGKVRSPWVSTLIRIIIILGYLTAFSLVISFFDFYDEEVVYRYCIVLPIIIVIQCVLLQFSLKWKRLAFYLLILVTVVFLAVNLIYGSKGHFMSFLLMLPVIVSILVLLGTKYRGKTFFEQTEPVAENIRDKQFLKSFALALLSLSVIGIGAALFMAETRDEGYATYDVTEEVYPDSTAVESADPAAEETAPVEEPAAEEPKQEEPAEEAK